MNNPSLRIRRADSLNFSSANSIPPLRTCLPFNSRKNLLSLGAIGQPPFSAYSGFRVHPSDLLHARVIIASYN
jgi:hypothetical protein